MGCESQGPAVQTPYHHQADNNNDSPYQGPPACQTLAKSVASSLVVFYEYEEGAHFTDGETETRRYGKPPSQGLSVGKQQKQDGTLASSWRLWNPPASGMSHQVRHLRILEELWVGGCGVRDISLECQKEWA